MGWETVRPASASPDPQLSIYPELGGYINADADQRWFQDVDAVEIEVDPDSLRLGFKPAAEDSDTSYSFTRVDEHGAEVRLSRALERFGIDHTTLDETAFLDLEWDGERAVADLSSVVPSPSPANDGSSSEDEDGTGGAGDDPADGLPPADVIVHSGIECDHETRQRLLDYLHGITQAGESWTATASEIGEPLDLKGTTAGQHLRLLRDADQDIGVLLERRETEGKGPAEWHIAPSEQDETAGGGRSEDEQAVVDAFEAGARSVHAIAAETGLPSDRVRAVARDLGRYSELEDAAEGGGYGRAGTDD